MAVTGYERVVATETVKTQGDLHVPPETALAEIQADTQNVRYTMDGDTDPNQTRGMTLLTTAEPKTVLIEDLKNIRFVRGAATDGVLNIHYIGG